jgi:hypothetical protein
MEVRPKTDTNILNDLYGTRPSREHTQPPWLPNAKRTHRYRWGTVEVAGRCHCHHSSTSQRLQLHWRTTTKEDLAATASWSSRQPMPNIWLFAHEYTTGSSDSENELQRGYLQDSLQRKPSQPDRLPQDIVPAGPQPQLRLHSRGGPTRKLVGHTGTKPIL